ncbi:MAG: aspartyl/asparaginyl beta-hydroxylase domain-containing protein [Rhizobiales bacterium]|nr:aspartyl/asparaginyl beta-hydroxylase domain-containing protein [Hyphomicrobiales bacterium]
MDARFPDRLRLPLAFEPAGLAADMANFSQGAWIAHFVTQNYDGDWSVIALRGPAGATHPVQMIYSDPSRSDYEDTPMLAGSPYFRQVLAAFACPLQAVRLMRLAPGSTIKEHHDNDLSFEQGMVRIHIPVVTNTEVDFRLNGTRVAMPAGSCWYLRLSDPHSVANRGVSERVHLVIDAAVNDWVTALFERAAAAAGGRAA